MNIKKLENDRFETIATDIMTVFEINDCDYVAAKDEEQAISFYKKEYGIDENDIREVELDNEYMIYDIALVPETFKLSNKLSNAELLECVKGIYKGIEGKGLSMSLSTDLGYKIARAEEFGVHMSFRKVLEIEKSIKPYLVSSTEY